MDLLGLRTLTVIGETVGKIKENRGIVIDIEKIPLDDKKNFSTFSYREYQWFISIGIKRDAGNY